MLCKLSDSGSFSWCFIQGIKYLKSSKYFKIFESLRNHKSFGKMLKKTNQICGVVGWGEIRMIVLHHMDEPSN